MGNRRKNKCYRTPRKKSRTTDDAMCEFFLWVFIFALGLLVLSLLMGW